MRDRLPPAERMALTVPEAALQLGISKSLAYELVRDHRLPSILVGNTRRVPRRALEAWIEAELVRNQGA